MAGMGTRRWLVDEAGRNAFNWWSRYLFCNHSIHFIFSRSGSNLHDEIITITETPSPVPFYFVQFECTNWTSFLNEYFYRNLVLTIVRGLETLGAFKTTGIFTIHMILINVSQIGCQKRILSNLKWGFSLKKAIFSSAEWIQGLYGSLYLAETVWALFTDMWWR